MDRRGGFCRGRRRARTRRPQHGGVGTAYRDHSNVAIGRARSNGSGDLRLESLDEFTGTYFVGVPDITTLPLMMFTASLAGNYQIAAITALMLLVPSIAFMLLIERFLNTEMLAKVG